MTASIAFTTHRFGGPGDPSWGSGAPGVVYTLHDSTGKVAGSTTSGGNGWCMIGALTAGSYTLTAALPNGLAFPPNAAPQPWAVKLVDGQAMQYPQLNLLYHSTAALGIYSGFVSVTVPMLPTISAALGRTPTIVNLGIDWRPTKSSFPGNLAMQTNYLKSVNSPLLPAVSIPLGSVADGDKTEMFAKIAAGQFDALYESIFSACIGRPPGYLRLGWEMNGTWYPWSLVTAQDATDFIECWRYLTTMARAILPGWKMLFSLSQVYPAEDLVNSAYPGDDVVDVIGIDSYANAYALDHTNVGTVIALANAHSRPFAVCESGSDNAPFIQSLATAIKPAKKLEYFTVWNSGPWQFTSPVVQPVADAWKALVAGI